MFKAVLLEVAIRYCTTATRVEAVVVEVGSHGLVITVPPVSDHGFRAAGNRAVDAPRSRGGGTRNGGWVGRGSGA